MENPENASARLTGVRYVGDGRVFSAVFTFQYNGARFEVVAASPEDEAGGEALVPPLYKFDESLEGKALTEISDLSWGEFDETRDKATERLEKEFAKLAADACLQAMQQLVPIPIPDTQILEQYLYPQTYILQILTDFERTKLTCQTLDAYAGLSDRHPPISEDELRAMGLDLETTDIPLIRASQVILVRRLQGLVWKVMVDREELVCKAAIDRFEHPLVNELETYLKVRSAGVALRIPELKGIVVSDKGVIGILLGYIPHEYHSLRALLAGIDAGSILPGEATVSLRRIEETLRGLHRLGILWRDIKTDNILIDDDDDAVVLDFGGGNTVGWVDQDKYGSMDGEEQGLLKIKEALGVEV
ncbi:uncharacterized protein B0H64DRAFT_378648 [Chaetomium fimeti]|uniref:Protein kinase domain-containing protein n=1 Tax=Chaetomium fimeti TaxID=1854472 RepID=A0AAE0H7N2_9PEZI|nr:hypothetical protein B0H64DRAFT_378648 [Chaetomium fimeti]